MLALYRSGRQADALESYRAVRALLVHELAVEPGPQLRQLQLAILAQDPALDLPRPVARPGTAPPPEVPAGLAAPGEGSSEAAAHPGRRRHTRRAGLALGAAGLAVLARDPAAGGAWYGPDLARARKLVAASGTAWMRVTVWDTVTPPGTVNETRDAVATLRQLGYRASLRRLPESTYFAYTLDSRNHAQIIDGGWSADYPSADTFIGKLACTYFAPGNGPATSDGSEFCDPAVDRQITRAAALQATDPQAAAARWAQLDRQLTDRAVFLPTVTPNEVDLLSRRAGNFQYNPVWGALIDQLWVR
jgi:ABC-type transport system substrate-binding protein